VNELARAGPDCMSTGLPQINQHHNYDYPDQPQQINHDSHQLAQFGQRREHQMVHHLQGYPPAPPPWAGLQPQSNRLFEANPYGQPVPSPISAMHDALVALEGAMMGLPSRYCGLAEWMSLEGRVLDFLHAFNISIGHSQ